MSARTYPEALLFDLDGTLIDSAADIHAALNAVATADGLAPFALDDVRSYIGNGIAMTTQRAYAARNITLDPRTLQLKAAAVNTIYESRNSALTTLMPGTAEMLSRYSAAGVHLAIVTNKVQSATEAVLAHFGIARYFSVVIGDGTLPRKPEPDMLLHALATFDVRPARAAMVGDSPADVAAAKAARVPSIVIRGGYSTTPVEALGAGAVIDTLFDLPKGIEKLLAAAEQD